MSYECFRDMQPIARQNMIECARLYSREWMRKKRAVDPDFCQRERERNKLYRRKKSASKVRYVEMVIGPLDQLTDEELICVLRDAAAVFFRDREIRLLEELIRRFMTQKGWEEI